MHNERKPQLCERNFVNCKWRTTITVCLPNRNTKRFIKVDIHQQFIPKVHFFHQTNTILEQSLTLEHLHPFQNKLYIYSFPIIDSTNSSASNFFRSSIFSPTPMNTTGILSSFAIPNTTPPLALLSSLVTIIPLIRTFF